MSRKAVSTSMLSTTMQYQYTPYILLLLSSALVTALLAVYVWRRRAVPGAVQLVVLSLMASGWSLTNALEMSSTDLPTKIFWANFQYLFYVGTPVAWLALAVHYTHLGRRLTRNRLMLLSLVPLATVALVWTNDLHGLMRRDVFLDTDGPFSVIGKTYGPWFWINRAYSYALLILTLMVLIRALLSARGLYRGQQLTLVIGLLLPLSANFLYVFGLSPVRRFDLTPALFTLASVVVALGLFRYRLFDIAPVARHTVVESMSDGVIVLDVQNRIVDVNPAIQRMLPFLPSPLIGQQSQKAFSGWPDFATLCCSRSTANAELTASVGGEQRDFEIHVSPLADRGGSPTGKVILLHDATGRKRAQSQMLQQQRALAILEERDRLARELHDSLGQVLGFVNTQAQAVRELLANKHTAEADAHLARLIAVAQDVHADVREYIFGLKTAISPKQGLLPALEHYLQRFGQNYGLRTELIVCNEPADGTFQPAAEVQLLRIVQEALTNVRKHASASRVTVTFATNAGHAEIVVEDDGRGVDLEHLLAGSEQTFGLRIMRERVQEVAGNVEVVSAPGRGTKVIVRVPLQEGRGGGADENTVGG